MFRRIYIIFNGEIFNFKEIRIKLIKLGYKFISDSDTEVALNAYKECVVVEKELKRYRFLAAILDERKKWLLNRIAIEEEDSSEEET